MSFLPWHHDHGDHPGHGGPTGPAVVLLHAFPLSSAMWDRMVPRLARSTRVITVDLPGLGRTGRPDADPSMRAMADAVVAVLDHLALPAVTVAGLSTGGYVALEVAHSYPERLQALGLLSTTCRVTEPDLPDERRALATRIERTRSLEPLLDTAEHALSAAARRDHPELARLVTDLVTRSDPDGVAWAARAIAARHDRARTLATVDVSVLLLFGEEDTETPPHRGEEMLDVRAGAGHTDLVVLPGSGHLTALERPDDVAAAIAALTAQARRH